MMGSIDVIMDVLESSELEAMYAQKTRRTRKENTVHKQNRQEEET